jgi:tRNA dimethylallyltransferase
MSSTDGSDASSVRVICGPTAAGKSAVAMALAERYGALVISADSRQIYRGFDIGTAKPSREEQSRVPHRGIDIVEPVERFSAAVWAERAHGWIGEAHALGRVPMIVGGTGFYLRALFAPLFASPPLDPLRRGALEAMLAGFSTDELRRWCQRLDPERAHLGRTQLLRAVETALLTGERLSHLHRLRSRAPALRGRYLVIDPGPPLAARIARRIDEMLAAGWVEEVRGLMRVVPEDAPAWNASGYAVVRALAAGRIGESEARERILVDTRQYAKRQRTWFRHQIAGADIARVDPDDPSAADVVRRWWEGAEGP